jgi:hypothetical protein
MVFHAQVGFRDGAPESFSKLFLTRWVDLMNSRQETTGGRRALVFVAVLLAVAGCTSQPAPTASLRPYVSGTASEPAAASSDLPLRQYLLRGRDFYTVENALVILTQQCMNKQGFTVQIPPPAPVGKVLMSLTYRAFGAPDSLAGGQKYGYQLPADEVGGPASGMAFESSLTQAESLALGGSGPAMVGRYRNGCLGVADRQLMSGTTMIRAGGEGTPPFIHDVLFDPRATDSPAVETDLKVFARCMASAGYPGVSTPLDLPAQFDNAATFTGTPSAAQISAAVAEFGCRQSSGLKAATRAAVVAFQLKAIDANPEAFAQVKAELAVVVRRATTTVAGG